MRTVEPSPNSLACLAVVIPTLNASDHLERCIAALGPVAAIVVADGGSTDATVATARRLGAVVVAGSLGRGVQLAAGAEAAMPLARWLLFLHADTVLEPGWREQATAFCTDPRNNRRAAAFRFALDDDAPAARRLTAMVALRARWLGLPYGDQGLLIHREFYRELGGFEPIPLMEDVAIVRRIGRRRLVLLPAAAVTSAERWRREGWWRRSARNLLCLSLYFGGVPPRMIRRIYG